MGTAHRHRLFVPKTNTFAVQPKILPKFRSRLHHDVYKHVYNTSRFISKSQVEPYEYPVGAHDHIRTRCRVRTAASERHDSRDTRTAQRLQEPQRKVCETYRSSSGL